MAGAEASGQPRAPDVTASAPDLPVLSLQDALDSASAHGDDFAIVQGSLSVAKAQRNLDLAKQGLNLTAGGAYALDDNLGKDYSGSSKDTTTTSYDQSLISKAAAASIGGSALSSYTGISQSPQASVSLSTPLTKLNLSFSQSIPAQSADPSSYYSSNPNATGFNQTSVGGAVLTQTLWDGYQGGQFQATLAKSLLSLQGKELSAQQGGSAAVTKVKTAYIAVLTAQRDLAVKRQVLDKQTRLLAQIQATYALKQATAIDLKTAQVNARSADIDVRTAQKTLSLASERLAVMIGRDPKAAYAVADLPDPEMPAATVEEAIAVGLQKRTDVAQLELNAKSSLIDAALARAASQPSLSVSGGVGLAVGWLPTPVYEGAVSLSAKVAMPVYDSRAAELQARTSENQASLYRLQAAQLRKTLSSDIRDYFESAQLLAEKISLAKDSMDLAESQFELIKAQNQFGTATVQDVLTASVTAATAEVAYANARNSYLGTVLQLSTAMGL